jgi:hypothetical protein
MPPLERMASICLRLYRFAHSASKAIQRHVDPPDLAFGDAARCARLRLVLDF